MELKLFFSTMGTLCPIFPPVARSVSVTFHPGRNEKGPRDTRRHRRTHHHARGILFFVHDRAHRAPGGGRDPGQAASGLTLLCLAVGLSTLVLAWRTRIPTTAAWSTPGAVLLGGAGAATGSFVEAVVAFLICAAPIVASGLWQPLTDLAGIQLPLCAQVVAGPVLLAALRRR